MKILLEDLLAKAYLKKVGDEKFGDSESTNLKNIRYLKTKLNQ